MTALLHLPRPHGRLLALAQAGRQVLMVTDSPDPARCRVLTEFDSEPEARRAWERAVEEWQT